MAMVTVLRAQGFRIVIFVNDHEPAHVHVFGDGEAKINLRGTAGTPDQLVEGFAKLEEVGVERVMLQHIRHEDLETVELLGREVVARV